MTEKELRDVLDSWENLSLVIREIGIHPEYFDHVMKIALYEKEKKSWRAAYLADKIHDTYPELLFPYIGSIVLQLKTETNTSKKRHFLKLLSMHTIPEKHDGFLVEYCLAHMSSGKEPPAVRVHAMQILFNISEKEPGLKPEILALIEHEMEYHATPGIISRGSKLAKKLRSQINSFQQ